MVYKNLYENYSQLLQEYSDPIKYWPQWCAKKKSVKEREKVIIGMILVQRTSWHNAGIALKNLKRHNLLNVKKISELKNLEQLTQIVRPAGFYQSKPKRLFDICTFITKLGGVRKMMRIEDTENLRRRLLSIKGVGQETADTILLYALDKPVFVIEIYPSLGRKRGHNQRKRLF